MTATKERRREILKRMKVLGPTRMLRLLKIIKVDSVVFDGAVHKAKSYEASAINNGGLESQIKFLMKFDKNTVVETVTGILMEMKPLVAEATIQHMWCGGGGPDYSETEYP